MDSLNAVVTDFVRCCRASFKSLKRSVVLKKELAKVLFIPSSVDCLNFPRGSSMPLYFCSFLELACSTNA